MLRLETSARGQATDIGQKGLARGQQHHVHIIAMDREIGPVPLKNHDAAVDHLVLNRGPENHVLLDPTSRRRATSAGQFVVQVAKAKDVAKDVRG